MYSYSYQSEFYLKNVSENDANRKQILLRKLYRIKMKGNGNSVVISLVKSFQRVSFALN